MVIYQGTKLSTKFNIKYQTKFQHKNNIVYYNNCPVPKNNKRDNKSHLLKYALDENHTHVWEQDFKIFCSNYQSNIKRKISEALANC